MIDYLLRKASPVLSMAEQSDAFKQLDAVGKSRYNEKLGMLGITTDPYMTPKDASDVLLMTFINPQSILHVY